MRREHHEVDFSLDVVLDVEAEFNQGFPATMETPKENEGWVPVSVRLFDIDITERLTSEELSRIEERLNVRTDE